MRHALDKGCELEALSAPELAKFSDQFGPDFAAAIALPRVLAEHDVPGGTAPARVAQALKSAEERIAALRKEAYAHA